MKLSISMFLLAGGITLASPVTSQVLPIKPARTLSFTTSEGSYMNVDVSPDNKTLVFDLLGDLYTVPVKGGFATQLTHGLALHLRPVWSSDGNQIAYSSDGSGEYRVHLLTLSNQRDTTLDVNGYGDSPVWISGGKTIYKDGKQFSTKPAHQQKWAQKISSKGLLLKETTDGRIYWIDSGKLYCNNQSVRTILDDDIQGEDQELSPDVSLLAYITENNGQQSLCIRDLVHHSDKILIPGLRQGDTRFQQKTDLPHYSFSPDSISIFISYGGQIHRITLATNADEIIPFTANVKVDLGPLNKNNYHISQKPFEVKYMRNAAKTPDGKHLIFMTLGRIYIQSLPNGKPKLLADQTLRQFQPAISPDGEHVAYVTWCDTSGGAVWETSTHGGIPIKLTNTPGQYQWPTWSPDGKSLAVIRTKPKLGNRDDDPMGKLENIDLATKQATTLADSALLWNEISFSTDGKFATFIRQVKGGQQLVCRDLTTQKTTVIKNQRGHFPGSQYVVSTDNQYMIFSVDEDLYLQAADQGLPIRFAAGVDPRWEKDREIIHWTYGNHFYSAAIQTIINTGQQQLQAEKALGKVEDQFLTAWIKPDEDIKVNFAVPTKHSMGAIALTHVQIITMDYDKIIDNGTIIIDNGRIIKVGKLVNIPPNAKIIDLSGKTVMPGLIDVHLHMRIPPNVFPQQSWMFLANLAYGVTTARDPSLSFDSFGYAEMIQTGQMLGPRLFTVGNAVRLTDGVLRMDNEDDATAVVKKRKELGGSEIKQYTLHTRLQRQLLAIACKKQQMNMTNEGDEYPIWQWGMVKDGSTGVEHNPAWGDSYSDVIKMYALSGSYLTPTLQVAYGMEEGKEYFKEKYWQHPDKKLLRFMQSDTGQKRPFPTDNGAESLQTIMLSKSTDTIKPEFLTPARIDAAILHNGGKITMGSHGNDEGIGPHNEIWALQMGGMTNMEALRCATLSDAEALGIQQDLGSIEVGKIADLLILNKNPLDDIHNTREIKYVMKDGILYDGDTLDELWPVYKKCPEWKMKTTINPQK